MPALRMPAPPIRALTLGVLSIGALTAGMPTAPAAAQTATPRTSLPAIERQVMCVTCKIPLLVAESAQADRERAYIRELIDQGESEAQIKQALVAQYGPQVLALPSTHGFGLTAYLVPVAMAAIALAILALAIFRWRRRGRARGADATEDPPLSPSDAARLEADLARFD